MGVKIDRKGTFGGIFAPVKKEIGQVVRQTAKAVQADAVLAIQTGPKTGRAYAVGNVTRAGGSRNTKIIGDLGAARDESGRFIVGNTIHRASAPGEAPANLSGTLANDLTTRFVDELTTAVEDSAAYALRLEYGSADGKTAARPYLGPAMERQKDGFEKAVAAAVSTGAAVAATAKETGGV